MHIKWKKLNKLYYYFLALAVVQITTLYSTAFCCDSFIETNTMVEKYASYEAIKC